MILIIDNYDSFTYNIVQYLGELGAQQEIIRNDDITAEELKTINPEKLIISPGPCSPKEAGLSCSAIEHFGSRIPVLGVCLGHQCIGHVFGGNVIRAPRLMHGKTSPIHHHGDGLFKDMSNPFDATRYHSLIVEKATLPDTLVITAETAEEEIMGLKHAEYPVYGVQFHPESILTQNGKTILANFLKI